MADMQKAALYMIRKEAATDIEMFNEPELVDAWAGLVEAVIEALPGEVIPMVAEVIVDYYLTGGDE